MTATDVTAPGKTRGPHAKTPKPRGSNTRSNRNKSHLLTFLMWICGLYFVLPLVWLAISSTKDTGDLFTTFGFAFGDKFALWDNVVEVFTLRGGIFTTWFINTLIYALAGAIGAALLSTLAGYAFAKYQFPGSKVLFSITLGAIMIPLTALAIPTYLVFNQIGITNTVWAVILPSLVTPFGVYLIRVYAADAIPDSLIEAARVDGAGEFRIFAQVALRLLGPAVVTVFMFGLVATWNNYFLPLIMLNSSDLYPLTVGLAQIQSTSAAGGGSSAAFSTVLAGSFISIIPLVLAFLFLQRYWQSGLATGSVKE